MRKKICFFLFIGIIVTSLAAHEEFDIDSRIFIPPVYYVGDEVELRLKVKITGEDIDIEIPEEMPVKEWIEIREITRTWYREDMIILNIFFITFKPGKHVLPSIDLMDILLEGIEIKTHSILEERDIKKIRPGKGQLELPGTRFSIGFLIALLIILPLIAIFLFNNIMKIWHKLQQIRQKELPGHKLKRTLRKLEKTLNDMDSREFYIRIGETVKEYLAGRLLIPALTLTTGELTRFFNKSIKERSIKIKIAQFADILKYSDIVKFGGVEPGDHDKRDTITEILEIVNSIEEDQENVEP